MEFDLTFYAFAIPAVIFAGISKGGFGSGAAFASAAILAVIVPPGAAIGVMLPLLMLMDVGAIRAYWGQWDWYQSKVAIIGGVPGVALGAALYSVANPDVFRFLIGAISVGFVFWHYANIRGWVKKAAQPIGTLGGLIAGATGGLTSFISHAGGPPVAVYLLSHPVTKTSFQASTVLIFTVINIAKVPPYAALGIFTSETLFAALMLSPLAWIGVKAGVRLHHIVPEPLFFRITYILLLITGTKLIWDALT